MPKPTKSLKERLQAHPKLKEQLLGLLELAERGIDSERNACLFKPAQLPSPPIQS